MKATLPSSLPTVITSADWYLSVDGTACGRSAALRGATDPAGFVGALALGDADSGLGAPLSRLHDRGAVRVQVGVRQDERDVGDVVVAEDVGRILHAPRVPLASRAVDLATHCRSS